MLLGLIKVDRPPAAPDHRFVDSSQEVKPPENILDWIDVGKVSAERDENLIHYFFDNGLTKGVVENRETFLVLGRKGAGKTAVFRYLSENPDRFLAPQDILVPLSFEDYNWAIHGLLRTSAAAESLAYKQSWRFVIFVEAIKAVARWLEENREKLPKSIAAAMKLLEKIFDNPVPSIYQIIGHKLLGLSKAKLPSVGLDGDLDSVEIHGGEVSFEDVKADVSMQSTLSQNVDNLIAFLERCIEEADLFGRRVFLAFDRVDEAWDQVSLDISKKVIAGLVSAADAVSAKHRDYLRPLVFLREDIFETLSLNDANKLREDCGALLHWTKSSILDVLLARLNFYLKKFDPQAKRIADLDELFDKSEMRQRAKPSSYMLKRSMMRPRDMICFVKRTIEAMREGAEDPFDDGPADVSRQMKTDAIYEAETGYSEWLRKELVDEWGVQYPEIGGLLEVLQNNGSTNIGRDVLSDGVGKAVGDASRASTMRHMGFLFDNSVIGFKVGGSTAWRFKCFYPSQGFAEADEYHVHDGLIRALNLKEPREKAAGSEDVEAD